MTTNRFSKLFVCLLVASFITTACAPQAPSAAQHNSQTEEVVVMGGYEQVKFMKFSNTRAYEWAVLQSPGYGPNLVTIFYLHALEDGALDSVQQVSGFAVTAPTWGTVNNVYMMDKGVLHVRQAIKYVTVGDYIIEATYTVCEVNCSWLDEQYGNELVYDIGSAYKVAANGWWDRVSVYYYMSDGGAQQCGIVNQETWNEDETCTAVIEADGMLKSVSRIGVTEIIVEFDDKGVVKKTTTVPITFDN